MMSQQFPLTGHTATNSKVDAGALYFSPHRVLDFRIMDMNLDPMFEQPMETSKYQHYLTAKEAKKKMTGAIFMQLGEFEPVQYHFRGYPLTTPTAGIVCLLPKKEDRMKIHPQSQQHRENNDSNEQGEDDMECSFLNGPGDSYLVLSRMYTYNDPIDDFFISM